MKNKYLKYTNYTILFLLLLYILSFFFKSRLPNSNKIVPELFQLPIQSSTNTDFFTYNYHTGLVKVWPQANYEIWGLIVSHNDIDGIMDIVHDKDSIDIKDFCMIRGDNIKSEIYKKLKFSNGMRSCSIETKDNSWETWSKFKKNNLSNNHLISSDEKVLDIIRSVRIGDQIYMKGMLVDYWTNNCGKLPQCTRQTSLSRDDTNESSRSGGACEVFFVKEIKILKRGNWLWYLINDWILYLIILLFILKIYLTGNVAKNEGKTIN